MNIRIVAGSVLSALALAAPLSAQLVSADVVVRSGPVRGHVVIRDQAYSTYRRPSPAYERPTRVIVVERFRNHREFRQWKRHGFRKITIYHVDGRYYDRKIAGRGVREVVVYEKGGRYYRDDDRRDTYRDRNRDRNRHHDRHHDHDDHHGRD